MLIATENEGREKGNDDFSSVFLVIRFKFRILVHSENFISDWEEFSDRRLRTDSDFSFDRILTINFIKILSQR